MKNQLKEQERFPWQRYLDPHEALKLAVEKSRSLKKAALGEYLIKHLLEFFREYKAVGEGADAHSRLRRFTPPLWSDDIPKSQVRDDCNRARYIIELGLAGKLTAKAIGILHQERPKTEVIAYLVVMLGLLVDGKRLAGRSGSNVSGALPLPVVTPREG
jgi:hypothetical protein